MRFATSEQGYVLIAVFSHGYIELLIRMLKSYVILTLRTIRRHKTYAAINITGLAVGLASCILILLYVYDELTFDRFHEKADIIYRVTESQLQADQSYEYVGHTSGAIGPLIAREIPEVTSYVRLLGRRAVGRRTLERDANRFYEEFFFFADPSFSAVFDFEWLMGNDETALAEPQSIVLTESAVEQYFGDENPMGETLTMEQWGELTVTGVLQDPPNNSHLDFRFLVSISTIDTYPRWRQWFESWNSIGVTTYFVSEGEQEFASVHAKFDDVVQRYQTNEFAENRQASVQALTDIHFGSRYIDSEENWREGNRAYLFIFSLTALVILLIACFNYINLATAQAMKRAREVGVRKVLGAERQQLFGQFIGESILLSLFAMVIALGLVFIALPLFNAVAGKEITLHIFGDWRVITSMIILVVLVGISAGSYPAVYLGQFMPVRVLKGSASRIGSAVQLRHGLVITQFVLSIALLFATFVIGNQLHYLQNQHVGFNKEALVTIDINSGDVRGQFDVIKRELNNLTSVQAVSVSSQVPGDWKTIPQIDVQYGSGDVNSMHRMYFIGADEDFLSTFEMSLAGGRNFSGNFSQDSTSVLMNETAARVLGIHEPEAQLLHLPTGNAREGSPETLQVRVVGIVDDFHFQSLHDPIAPLIIGYRANPFDPIDYFSVRIQTERIAETIPQIQGIVEFFDPERPFEYNFLDDRMSDFYVSEQRVSKLFTIAAILSICIACLGLFGLASFIAGQRTKEIGVRKTLGASVTSIVLLLARDFIRPVFIALIIATPLAFWVMNQWLNGFAYRTSLEWWLVPVIGALTITLALLTISYQSVSAAQKNPVETLHYE